MICDAFASVSCETRWIFNYHVRCLLTAFRVVHPRVHPQLGERSLILCDVPVKTCQEVQFRLKKKKSIVKNTLNWRFLLGIKLNGNVNQQEINPHVDDDRVAVDVVHVFDKGDVGLVYEQADDHDARLGPLGTGWSASGQPALLGALADHRVARRGPGVFVHLEEGAEGQKVLDVCHYHAVGRTHFDCSEENQPKRRKGRELDQRQVVKLMRRGKQWNQRMNYQKNTAGPSEGLYYRTLKDLVSSLFITNLIDFGEEANISQ